MDEILSSSRSGFPSLNNSLEYAHSGWASSGATFLYHFRVLYGLDSWEEVST
jgi:hypothetical protein